MGTRQGNMLSGAIYRDQSCLVFKQIKRLKKGIELILPITLKRIRQSVIAYLDYTDFFSNSQVCIAKIQEIIDMYVKLYEATSAKIQEEKVKFYCWQYRMINGERVIEQVQVIIWIHQKAIA